MSLHTHHVDHLQPEVHHAIHDPVCGMPVTEQSTHHLQYQNKTYYFCSEHCLAKFEQEPTTYIPGPDTRHRAQDSTELQGQAGTTYTCPMHPEIVQESPGVCPKCGMALELVLPSLDADDNPELRDFQRRFWRSLPFTVLVTCVFR